MKTKIKTPANMYAVTPSNAAVKMRRAILNDIRVFLDEVDVPEDQDHLALTEVVNTLSMVLAQVAYPLEAELVLKFFNPIYRNHAAHIKAHYANGPLNGDGEAQA